MILGVYIVLYLVLALFSLIEITYSHKKEYRNISLFTSMLIILFIILFVGLRYETGADYYSYVKHFNKTNSISFSHILSQRIEPGFLLINYIIKNTLHNHIFLFLFIALASIGVKYKFCLNYSYYIFIPIFYYFSYSFLPLEMGQIRHALSIGILLISVRYIIQNNFYKFAFWVLIATTIHYSSIVFILTYFFNKIKLNRKRIIVIFIIAIIIGMVNINNITIEMLKILPDLTPIRRAISYLRRPNIVGRRGIALQDIWKTFLIIIFLTFYKKMFKQNEFYNGIFQVYFFGIIIWFSMNSIDLFARRFAHVYNFIEGILISYFIFKLKHRRIKILILLILSFIMLIRFSNVLSSGRYVPYKNVLYNYF
ncbi:MAG: EpsG family protein [Candidatus Woesearchaeota archaeon]